MAVRRLVFLIAVAILSCASSARAATQRLALVRGGDELKRAVDVALSSWGIEVIAADVTPPRATMPDAANDARDLAAAQGVHGVAWITRGETEPVLWVYDAETQQVLSRPLGVASFDDSANAAAVALSLKALLRSSTVAPRSEQIGAGARQAPLFRLESTIGARSFARDNASIEPRLGFGVTAWPRPLGGAIGFGIGFSSGLGASVEGPALTGRFGDWTIASAARARWTFGGVVLEPGLGVGVHVVALDGALTSPQVVVHARRTDGSLDGSLAVALRLGDTVDLGLRASASYLLRYQRYLVDGQTALELSPIWLELGAHIGVALF